MSRATLGIQTDRQENVTLISPRVYRITGNSIEMVDASEGNPVYFVTQHLEGARLQTYLYPGSATLGICYLLFSSFGESRDWSGIHDHAGFRNSTILMPAEVFDRFTQSMGQPTNVWFATKMAQRVGMLVAAVHNK